MGVESSYCNSTHSCDYKQTHRSGKKRERERDDIKKKLYSIEERAALYDNCTENSSE